MLEHILVAIDFSPAWSQLRTRLLELPLSDARRITLAHALESGYGQAPELGHREHYEQRLDEEATALAREASAEVDWTLLVGGRASHELLAAAGAVEADTIVIGRTGHRRLREHLLGSTAEALCRNSDRPVLLIPTG